MRVRVIAGQAARVSTVFGNTLSFQQLQLQLPLLSLWLQQQTKLEELLLQLLVAVVTWPP